jgi:hypothetical protein
VNTSITTSSRGDNQEKKAKKDSHPDSHPVLQDVTKGRREIKHCS